MRLTINKSANQKYLWFNEDVNFNSYEQLKLMYPRFYDRVLEMQEILKAQGLILDDAKSALEIVLNNMFIAYMDEETLSQLEDFFNISVDVDKSLDARKLEIINHFCGYGKMSTAAIENIANVYNLNSKVFFNEKVENEENFMLRVKLVVPEQASFYSDYAECIKVLQIRLPAHLYRVYDIVFNTKTDIGLSLISVFYYRFNHQQDEVDLTNVPDYFLDDDGNMLLDDDGNIIIDEDANINNEGSDIDVL